MAGFLTRFLSGFPSRSLARTVDKACPESLMKLTAVDLFRIYTWFPFRLRM